MPIAVPSSKPLDMAVIGTGPAGAALERSAIVPSKGQVGPGA